MRGVCNCIWLFTREDDNSHYSFSIIFMLVIVCLGIAGLWVSLIVLSNVQTSVGSQVGIVVSTLLISSVVIVWIAQMDMFGWPVQKANT